MAEGSVENFMDGDNMGKEQGHGRHGWQEFVSDLKAKRKAVQAF